MTASKNEKMTAMRTNKHPKVQKTSGPGSGAHRSKGIHTPIEDKTRMGIRKTDEQWARIIEKFFTQLAATCKVVQSCEVSGISYAEVSRRRKTDPEFEQRYQDAMDEGIQRLEDEAARRAFHGVDEPVFYKGEQVADVKRYSDTLLMFLLKGNRPDKFKDRVENTNLNLDLAARLEAAKKRGGSK